jgi:hypothetical protein
MTNRATDVIGEGYPFVHRRQMRYEYVSAIRRYE